MDLHSPAFLAVFPWLALTLGLCLGSFYSVCSHRYLTEESIVSPGSHCPACKHRLAWWELVPVLSWILLRGRCSNCKERISPLYPAHELVSGLLAWLLAVKFGPTPMFLFFLAMGGLYITASMIDLQSFLLPDRLTLPAAVIALAGAGLLLPVGWRDALIGASAGYGLFWILAKAYFAARGVDGLGGGDVKLMLSIGALTGWMGLPFAILIGSLGALVLSPVFLFAGKKDDNPIPIPFGPFLCFGGMAQAVYGREITALIS